MADTSRHNSDVTNTKIRGFRIPEKLWKKAQRKADRRHETVSAVVIRALVDYTEGEPDLEEDE